MEVWGAMEALYSGGTTRQLGISHCHDPDVLAGLCRSARMRPAVVQNRFSATTGYDLGLREFCQRNGIVYQGFRTLTANAHVLGHAAVAGIASVRGVSAAQVFLRYLTQAGIMPLTGTTSAAHMREDLGIFDFELGDEERATIASALRACRREGSALRAGRLRRAADLAAGELALDGAGTLDDEPPPVPLSRRMEFGPLGGGSIGIEDPVGQA